MAYTYKHGDRPIEGITIQRAVGRGGFGEVYYGVSDSGKQVAVKYLRDNADVELRGISHVMNLKSPHLITIYDVRRNEHGDPFVIMEYVSGPSLRDLLNANPNGLGVQRAAFFLDGIVKGLSYLHERGIVHRDMKPGNIFYDDGYVKIGDYGLSKHIAVSHHSANTVSVGTVHYMAPEIGSGSYTKAIDIYALGVILYEMLTGRLPFTGSSMAEILMRHLSDRPNLAGVPEPFASVIAKALAKDPAARYSSADQMADALLAAGDVRADVASFDPSSLTVAAPAAAAPPAASFDRTMTSPGRPSAGMDARDAIGGIPPIPPLPGEGRAAPANPVAPPARAARPRDEAPALPPLERLTTTQKAMQFVVLGVVTVACSLVMGILSGADEPAAAVIAIAMWLLGGTAGALVAHFGLLQHSPIRHVFFDRVLMAAMVMLCMMPGVGPATANHEFWLAMFGPVAAVAICDWNQRILDGRRRKIDGGAAIIPAIVGMIGAGAAGGEDYVLLGGAMAAALSLLTQASAAAWGTAQASVPWSGATPWAAEPRASVPPAAAPAPAPAASPAPPPIPTDPERRGIFAEWEIGWSSPRRGSTPPAAPEAAPVYVVDAAQPSFVGRAANAGMSVVGKMLLLAGLAFGVLAFNMKDAISFGSTGQHFSVGGGLVRAVSTNDGEEAVFTRQIPRPVVFAPVLLGGVLILLARRSDGAAAVTRAIVGVGLALGAAAVATSPGVGAFAFGSGDVAISGNPHASQIAIKALLLASLAMVVLFWPRRKRNREIVI